MVSYRLIINGETYTNYGRHIPNVGDLIELEGITKDVYKVIEVKKDYNPEEYEDVVYVKKYGMVTS